MIKFKIVLLQMKYWTYHGSPFCVIICTSCKLLKMVRFLWPIPYVRLQTVQEP